VVCERATWLDPPGRKENDRLKKSDPWCCMGKSRRGVRSPHMLTRPSRTSSHRQECNGRLMGGWLAKLCWQDLAGLALTIEGVSTDQGEVYLPSMIATPSVSNSSWQDLDVWSDRRCTTRRWKNILLNVCWLIVELIHTWAPMYIFKL
jgi:hypothetical protein